MNHPINQLLQEDTVADHEFFEAFISAANQKNPELFTDMMLRAREAGIQSLSTILLEYATELKNVTCMRGSVFRYTVFNSMHVTFVTLLFIVIGLIVLCINQ